MSHFDIKKAMDNMKFISTALPIDKDTTENTKEFYRVMADLQIITNATESQYKLMHDAAIDIAKRSPHIVFSIVDTMKRYASEGKTPEQTVSKTLRAYLGNQADAGSKPPTEFPKTPEPDDIFYKRKPVNEQPIGGNIGKSMYNEKMWIPK